MPPCMIHDLYRENMTEKKTRTDAQAPWDLARAEGWSKLIANVPVDIVRQYVEFLDVRDVLLLCECSIPDRMHGIRPLLLSFVREVTIRHNTPRDFVSFIFSHMASTLESLNFVGVSKWDVSLDCYDLPHLKKLRRLTFCDCAYLGVRTLQLIWERGSGRLRILHVSGPGLAKQASALSGLWQDGKIPGLTNYLARNPNMTELVLPDVGMCLGLSANGGRHIRHLTRLEIALPSNSHVLATIGKCCPQMQTLALLSLVDGNWDASDLRQLTANLKHLRDLVLYVYDVRFRWYLEQGEWNLSQTAVADNDTKEEVYERSWNAWFDFPPAQLKWNRVELNVDVIDRFVAHLSSNRPRSGRELVVFTMIMDDALTRPTATQWQNVWSLLPATLTRLQINGLGDFGFWACATFDRTALSLHV
jgi:hypothetical protein